MRPTHRLRRLSSWAPSSTHVSPPQPPPPCRAPSPPPPPPPHGGHRCASTWPSPPAAAPQPASSFAAAVLTRPPGTRADLGVVLVSPQIPGNAGTTARTCAATRLSLTLVGPLGFTIDDARLKRSGLDYWPSVAGATFPSWSDFEAALGPDDRVVAFSTKGAVPYDTAGVYAPPPSGGCTYLVFGSETAGLPPAAHAAAAARGAVVTLPIDTAHVRSLNLAVSAGVGIYEALRQVGWG